MGQDSYRFAADVVAATAEALASFGSAGCEAVVKVATDEFTSMCRSRGHARVERRGSSTYQFTTQESITSGPRTPRHQPDEGNRCDGFWGVPPPVRPRDT
jgi:hypothetical protein